MRTILNRLLLVVTCLVGLINYLPVTQALALDQINHFHADIVLQPDTSIQITETIQYDTSLEKHGIYRYIPIRYHRDGYNFTARVKNIQVADDKGKLLNFETSQDRNNVTLKIGDADRTFTGKQTYIITYEVENAVLSQLVPNTTQQRPELFWDITGEGWEIPIASASAQIVSPVGKITQVVCYSGTVGSDDGACTSKIVSEDTAAFSYPTTITYGENMSVVVALDPQSKVTFPSWWQRWLKQLQDNLVLLPLLFPALIFGGWWWKNGRDTAYTSWNVFTADDTQPTHKVNWWQRRPTPLVYEPFKDLTPGEAGALLDERVDNQDVIAEIIDLARQKIIKIEQIEKKKLFGTATDYQFTKLKEPAAALPEHQQYLVAQLFKKGTVVNLSELKGSFASQLEKTRRLIFTSLLKRKMFVSHPQDTRGVALAVAIILLALTGWWAIALLSQGLWWALPILVLSVVVSLLAAYHSPAKTALGTNYALQAAGLKQTINYGAWREKIKEKHLFFEKVLPYAVAFGIVDRLSKDMAVLNVPEPKYLSALHSSDISTAQFIHAFSSQASSSLSYNPQSSSSSSGSGFSGGSSGGGGGGGGGGSW